MADPNAEAPAVEDAAPPAPAPAPSAEERERLPPTFGLKDVFTCINLLGGIFAIVYCIEGNIRYAGYAFLAGYFLGDCLDGLVARLTNTGNTFGKEFDAISDHLAQSIAPAFIVYVGYKDLNLYLAIALASVLIITGSIRHARAAVSPVNFPMAYMGLPRTASAFIIVSFLNSSLYIQIPGGRWVGVGLLVVLSAAHILPLPFRAHRGRALATWVKLFVFGFFSTTVAAALFFREFVFDVTFFWLMGYTLASWIPLSPEERRAFFARAREWSAEVRRAR
jgi:phosphatidylserine synthase